MKPRTQPAIEETIHKMIVPIDKMKSEFIENFSKE
jgi:hypothetical protein